MLNEKKFRDIYSGFLESGLTIRDYCANHQMNEAKFYYWQNKLKGQLFAQKGICASGFWGWTKRTAIAGSGHSTGTERIFFKSGCR